MTKPTLFEDGYASAEERLLAYLEVFLRVKERLIPVQYGDFIGINEPPTYPSSCKVRAIDS